MNRELAGLCASCAQGRLAPAAATASRPAGLASRMYSTGPTSATCLRAAPSPSQPTPRRGPATQRRWLSGTSASRSQGTTASPAGGEEEEGGRNTRTTGHKPLPYYALFPQTLPGGAPPDGPFDIDVRALRREFLQLQAASHPDYYHSAQVATSEGSPPSSSSSHSEPRRKAEALSSHINSAYRTLSSPLLRAQYVLAERYGVDLAGDEASRATGPADPALLMEVLEAREAIEEAASEADLEGVSGENDARAEAAVRGLARALEAGDVQAAVREAVRLRYWENIRESVRDWEEGGSGVVHH